MLTDLDCRTAQAGERDEKLTDSGGLSLLVRTSGTKTWIWKYRFGLKERKLTIGTYPAISLKQARAARDKARLELAEGIDPSKAKVRRRRFAAVESPESFEGAARAWHKGKELVLEPRYAKAVLSRLEANAFPALGHRPIRQISATEVLEVLRAVEQRKALTMARKLREHMEELFAWAIGAGLTDQNPAAHVRKAMLPKVTRHYPSVLSAGKARTVFDTIDRRPGVPASTRLASRLLALTGIRPGVLVAAAASEFEALDGAEPIWRIPAARMKLRAHRKADPAFDFWVPLSKEAASAAAQAIALSPSDRFVFPGARDLDQPLSENALNKLYREAGLQGLHVPHGWRTTFSTIMNEHCGMGDRDGDGDVIELMLAHMDGSVRATYNRAKYLPRRRVLAQEWADILLSAKPEPLAGA